MAPAPDRVHFIESLHATRTLAEPLPRIVLTPEQFKRRACGLGWEERTIALLLAGQPPLEYFPCGDSLVRIGVHPA